MTRHGAGWTVLGIGTLAVAAVCTSCATTSPSSEEEVLPLLLEFVPATFVAGLRVEGGTNPSLFSPDSYAIWVGSDVAALRQAKAQEDGAPVDPRLEATAQRINENFLIFECYTASVFGDMSIAYDAVGFRHVSVYLLTPDGRQVAPIQTVIGGCHEQQQQALKKYSRTNLIVFRKRDLFEGAPTISSDAPAVRLVFEGYETVFYFEWVASLTPDEGWRATADEYARIAKVGFTEMYQNLAALAHVFD